MLRFFLPRKTGERKGEVSRRGYRISYTVMGISFSLLGLFSTILIWAAGSPQYGALAQVWQLTGIQPLLSKRGFVLDERGTVFQHRAGSSQTPVGSPECAAPLRITDISLHFCADGKIFF